MGSAKLAIVYCEGAFNTPNGKTANGLVRFTKRYHLLSVIDSRYHGLDAGFVLDGENKGIKIYENLNSAYNESKKMDLLPECLVIGLAPDGGRLSKHDRKAVLQAIELGMDIHSGLHDYLSEDKELKELAMKHNANIIDIRKPPAINDLHFFSGSIEKVKSLKVAVLGTDSAVGKRTTAWILVKGLNASGYRTEMIGTGQTAWLQGAEYSIVIDSIINDFVSGEIENVIYNAYKEKNPDIIVIEGQGSLMNPAYPGGFEILAAGRPDIIILQHAPMRKFYDGFPDYPLHSVERQMELIGILSGSPVAALTINHEGISRNNIEEVCREMEKSLKIPVIDPLFFGRDRLNALVIDYFRKRNRAGQL